MTTAFAPKLVPVIVKYCKAVLPLSAIGGDTCEIAGETGGGGGGVVRVKNTVPLKVPTVAVAKDAPATRPVTRPEDETLDEPSVADVQTIGLVIVKGLPY